ncbi:MAG: imidazolonepropionase [Microbacteriaceae bacterium]
MTRTLFTNIGQLVTNDEQARDPLGLIADAAIVIDNERVTWVGSAAAAEVSGGHDIDHVVDCGGRAVIPGFVDAHSHLVFAGDRATEFEARMSGTPYSAGGIRSTVRATRSASEGQLVDLLEHRAHELLRQGTTTFETKSGYHLDVAGEPLACKIARGVTDEVTFLGAHVIPAEYGGRGHEEARVIGTREDYVDLVCGAMLEASAPHARWIDVFCDEGAFTVAEAQRVLEAGMRAGLVPRLHAAQFAPNSAAIALGVQLGCASIDHCTYLTDDDVTLLALSSTVVTLLPGVEFSTRSPYPDARRLIDAGVTVAISTDCNPGSSYTSSMAFCVSLAVREMGMTTAEALWSATAGGARALLRTDVGRLVVGARADLVELDAPSYVHLAYRPGVPLTRRVWKNGVVVAQTTG